MASPNAQPTVADAARLMDSLRLASAEASVERPAASSAGPTAPIRPPQPAPPSGGSHTHTSARSMVSDDYESMYVARHSGTGLQKPDGKRPMPSLPAEIVLLIGAHLASSAATASTFDCPHASVLSSGSSSPALLSLASASRAFRNTLVPLIWQTLCIRTPQDLPRLASLLAGYDTLAVRSRSRSPSVVRRSSPDALPGRDDGAGGLRHPLAHIRRIVVSIPDKYIDLDQTFLLSLLRSMHLARTAQLEHLSWSAEAPPSPAIWPLVAPSLKSLDLDCRTFFQGHRGMADLHRLEVLRMTAYDSTLLPRGAVHVLESRRDPAAALDGRDSMDVDEMPDGEARGRQSPVEELQRSVGVVRRQARHIYLDAVSEPAAQIESIERSGMSRLRHLSLSSSKTSVLHQTALISAGCFVGLTCLDIYAVTPEPPLARAILSAADTLTHLRLVLDISGAFGHFDALWSALSHQLPRLVQLEVDPMPQQNTAPSFSAFVDSCPRLAYINGRNPHSFPPCFGAFDPAHPSGALPF